MLRNPYRVLQHIIGYEPSTVLAGQADKLTKAENRAQVLVDGMRHANQTGYVMIRDHVKQEVAAVYFVESSRESETKGA